MLVCVLSLNLFFFRFIYRKTHRSSKKKYKLKRNQPPIFIAFHLRIKKLFHADLTIKFLYAIEGLCNFYAYFFMISFIQEWHKIFQWTAFLRKENQILCERSIGSRRYKYQKTFLDACPIQILFLDSEIFLAQPKLPFWFCSPQNIFSVFSCISLFPYIQVWRRISKNFSCWPNAKFSEQ